MKNTTIEEIAGRLGVTKSTVSRALNHCHNVASDTRRTILDKFGTNSFSDDRGFPIYLILPDNPSHFWGQLFKNLEKYEQQSAIPIKYNIYTNLSDTDIVLHYLEEAERIGSKAVILSAVITPEIREKLLRMQEHCAVFLLCEYADIVNTFYFGPDNYADGCIAAQIYLEKYTDYTPVAISLSGIRGIELKTEGFCGSIRKCLDQDAVDEYCIDIETSLDSRLFASKLASRLTEWLSKDKKYCLYIPFGSGNISSAIRKIGREENIICICHDINISPDSSCCIAASVNQNLSLQAEAVFRAAEKYLITGSFPDQKFTYIPSVITNQRQFFKQII